MAAPSYTDWSKVLLDTQTIIDIINASQGRGGEQAAFTLKLIKDLSKEKRKVQFYVSYITLSEIHNRLENSSKIKDIVTALSGKNVTFLAFDSLPSNYMAQHYGQYFSNKALNSTAHRLNWQGNDLVIAREWINRDLMLIATAQGYGLDVILSRDIKTLYPLAKEVGAFCAVAHEDCYQVTPNYIHEYYPAKAEALYQAIKPGPRDRGTGYSLPIVQQ